MFVSTFRANVLSQNEALKSFDRLQTSNTKYVHKKGLLKRKVRRTFSYLDPDSLDEGINLEEFKKFLSVRKIRLRDDEILKLFQYIDSTQKGSINFVELMRFIKIPFNPAEQIRMNMSLHIHNPAHFQEYHSLYVQCRPLDFKLVPGPNEIGTYFYRSSDPTKYQFLDRGSRLCFINNVRVDRANFRDIMRTLEKIPCPFNLEFQTFQIPNVIEETDAYGNFRLVRRELTKDWQHLLERPCSWNQAKGKQNYDLNYIICRYYDHCKHCPREKAWYLKIHLFMEDETFSVLSAILIFFIYFLIFVSTAIYIFETTPGLEWSGWETLEAVVSILFTIEFGVRISSCRNAAKYMKDPMNIVDFCAVIPFWIELISNGWLQPEILRMIRIIRLLRLVRLARSTNLALTLSVLSLTLTSVFEWILMFIFFIILTGTILSAFQYFNEAGVLTLLSDCDNLKDKTSCSGISILESFTFNQTSSANCRSSCQELGLRGCCFFDQITGNCVFHSGSSFVQHVSPNQSSLWTGLCRVEEKRIRGGESGSSPYIEIPSSMWWAAATVNSVGYGEIYPISINGEIIGAISCFVGLLCMAFPLIVVGSSFKVAVVKGKFLMNFEPDSDAHLNSVKWLLDDMNAIAGKEIFNPDDEFVFLANQLDTKNKVKQIFTWRRGWIALPFADDGMIDRPRISQFKLYILYGLYGKKLRYMKKARRKYRRAFKKSLGIAIKRDRRIKKEKVTLVKMGYKEGVPVPSNEDEPRHVAPKENVQENPASEAYVFSESLLKESESHRISEAKDLSNNVESKVTTPTILKESSSNAMRTTVASNMSPEESPSLVVQDSSRESGEEYGYEV